MSVASRKMTAYAKTDCIGASKGLFFGLLTLVLGLICLILFFVLIDHDNQQVSDTNYISAAFIQVRPPKDFGPKAQNLEGVRTCLRKCGTDITRLKK